MHEVSLVHALFDEADRALGARSAGHVVAVTVRIGELAGVERELFEAAFEACREDRGYAAAELDLVTERASWRCPGCGEAVAEGALRCARCALPARLVEGGAIFLDRLELEVPDV